MSRSDLAEKSSSSSLASQADPRAAVSQANPKIAILALGQFHTDPIPFALVNRMADFLIAENKKIVFGFEFDEGFEKSFYKEADFLREYDKYKMAKSDGTKKEALQELRKLPPLHRFFSNYEAMKVQYKASGREFLPYEQAEIEFLTRSPEVSNRLKIN